MNEITRLVEQYGNDVLRTAFVILKSRELAEDAYQETFLRVCRYYDSFRRVQRENVGDRHCHQCLQRYSKKRLEEEAL